MKLFSAEWYKSLTEDELIELRAAAARTGNSLVYQAADSELMRRAIQLDSL